MTLFLAFSEFLHDEKFGKNWFFLFKNIYDEYFTNLKISFSVILNPSTPTSERITICPSVASLRVIVIFWIFLTYQLDLIQSSKNGIWKFGKKNKILKIYKIYYYWKNFFCGNLNLVIFIFLGYAIFKTQI